MQTREWVRDIIRLDSQSVCPKCRANWVAIGEMLNHSTDSDNFWQAVTITENCPICAVRFQAERDEALQLIRQENLISEMPHEESPLKARPIKWPLACERL